MAPSKGDLRIWKKIMASAAIRSISPKFHKKRDRFIFKNKGWHDGSWRWRDRWMLTWGTQIQATWPFHCFQVFLQLIFSHLLDETHRNSASVCRDYPCTWNIIFISLSCNTYKHVYIYIHSTIYHYTHSRAKKQNSLSLPNWSEQFQCRYLCTSTKFKKPWLHDFWHLGWRHITLCHQLGI